jgi:hypothetical protein
MDLFLLVMLLLCAEMYTANDYRKQQCLCNMFMAFILNAIVLTNIVSKPSDPNDIARLRMYHTTTGLVVFLTCAQIADACYLWDVFSLCQRKQRG